MPKILKNFKQTKDGKFQILNYDVVFADANICEVEMDKEYDDLFVFNGIGYEREEFFKYNKEYKLLIKEDGTVEENENGQATCILPINVDLNNYVVDQQTGRLVRK